MPRPTPCLWFDPDGEDAARFYTSVFPNSRVTRTTHYGIGRPPRRGTRDDRRVRARRRALHRAQRRPGVHFDEAISFAVECETQEELDRYWETLSDGGEQGPCGLAQGPLRRLLADRAARAEELVADPDRDKGRA